MLKVQPKAPHYVQTKLFYTAPKQAQPRIKPAWSRQSLFAHALLFAGPLPIQGICDIVTDYSQDLEGVFLRALDTGRVNKFAALPDNKLASCAEDFNVVHVWDTTSGARLLTQIGRAHV